MGAPCCGHCGHQGHVLCRGKTREIRGGSFPSFVDAAMGDFSLVQSFNGRFCGPGPSFHVWCTGYGQVCFMHASILKLGLHDSGRFFRFCKHGHAGGVHVQPVDCPRHFLIRSDVCNDGVQQAFVLEAMPGLRTHAWRFVHDHQRLALVQHAQRDRPWTKRFRTRRAEQQCVGTTCRQSQCSCRSTCGRAPTFRASFDVDESCEDCFFPSLLLQFHGIRHGRLHVLRAWRTCSSSPLLFVEDVRTTLRHVSQDGFHASQRDVASGTSKLLFRTRRSHVARTCPDAPCDAHPRATTDGSGSDDTSNFAREFAHAPSPGPPWFRFDRKRGHVVAHAAAAKRTGTKCDGSGGAHLPRWPWRGCEDAGAKAK
mmetsp:Transcript_4592/g.29131  ORF Transcript_4592/g.29131 Transcript_4592/m.29131 type:complete len:368 (+) Transcript_4592:773-1876(+)